MADADLTEFYKYSKPKRPPCRIGHALATIRTSESDSDNSDVKRGDAKKLEAALAQDKNLITSSAIVTWLEKRGICTITSASPITAHRRKSCTCYDD